MGGFAVAPALLVDDDGETIEAFYAETPSSTGWIVFSPHVLADTRYAVHVLLHELAHTAGLEDEEVAEALAASTTAQGEPQEAPRQVREAEQKLREAKCTITTQEAKKLEKLTNWEWLTILY